MKININIIKKNNKDTDSSSKIIIMDSKNRVLFLKRSKKVKKFKSNWDLPGGHIQKNETPQKAAGRELMEETSLEISDLFFFEKTKKNKGEFFFFYGNYNNQPIKLSDEHTKFKFFKIKELSKKDKFQKMAIKVLERKENE